MKTYKIEYTVYRGFENTGRGNVTVEAENENQAYTYAKGFLPKYSDIDVIREAY